MFDGRSGPDDGLACASNDSEGERDLLLEREQSEESFRPTIEVTQFIIAFAAMLSGAVTNNYLLFRTCTTTLHYNTSKCELLQYQGDRSEETRALEGEVQARAAIFLMTMSVFGGLMPAILSFFLGAWSDQHGRKPLIVWPAFGLVASSVLIVCYCSFPSLSPWWLVGCLLPYSMVGGDSTLAMGSYCYITDVTSHSTRSFRLAVLQGSGFVGAMLGSVASNYVFSAIGYLHLFAFTAILYAMAWLYAVMWVPESVLDAEKGSLGSLFDLSLVKQMCSTCFKPRQNRTGVMLFLLILANSTTVFAISGIANFDYLFTRQTFNWMLKEYSIFSAVNTVILVFGMLIGIAFLQNVCRVSDAILTILSYASSILDATVRSLASQSWHMYLAGGLSMLGGLSPPLLRSLITKVVPPQEIGQIFALTSCCEAIVPVLSPILYSTVYARTLTTFPGAIYTLSAGFFGTCMLLIVITQCLMFRHPLPKYSPLENIEGPTRSS